MAAEMKNADPGPVEVLIGSMLASKSPATDWSATDTPMALLERRELDLHRYPVLASHIIGGKPVVPFALITEWIGHGALKENPGFSLHGIDDFRAAQRHPHRTGKETGPPHGRQSQKNRRCLAGGCGTEKRCEKRQGCDPYPGPGAFGRPVSRRPGLYRQRQKRQSRLPRDLDAIYGTILFHGDHLRAIKAIDDYSDHGMTARLTSAHRNPRHGCRIPSRDRWMADPMVLDGAFQMAIVWCFEQTGKVCLPSYARAYRQYRPAFPGIRCDSGHVGNRRESSQDGCRFHLFGR
jgi:hypothetical protein